VTGQAALDALGDPSRRSIVELLGTRAMAVGEIADQLPISRPAVSRHLRLLGEAGLVTHRAAGTRNLYELRAEGIEAVQAYFRSVWGEAAARFTLLAENTPER
jgi:DNA-binding transcriptional ArsR family regulator